MACVLDYYTLTVAEDCSTITICDLLNSGTGLIDNPDGSCVGITIVDVDRFEMIFEDKCADTNPSSVYLCDSNTATPDFTVTRACDGVLGFNVEVTTSFTVPTGYEVQSITRTIDGGSATTVSFPDTYNNTSSGDEIVAYTVVIRETSGCQRDLQFVSSYTSNPVTTACGNANLSGDFTLSSTLVDLRRDSFLYTIDGDNCVVLTADDFGLSGDVIPKGVYNIQIVMHYNNGSEDTTYTSFSGVLTYCDDCNIYQKAGEYYSDKEYNSSTELLLTYEALKRSVECNYEDSCIIQDRLNVLLGDYKDCNC